jgi:prolyl-tRNA synthetase
MVVNDFGEDTLVICDNCDFSDNQQIAIVGKPDPEPEDLLPMEDVETPGATTIEALANFLKIPKSKTAKAAFFMTGDGRFVVAIVRGDYDVNETKLVNAVKAIGGLRPATIDEIKARGHGGRLRLPDRRRDSVVVVDELVPGRRTSSRAPTARLARPQRQRPARLHARPGHEITNAREGDACVNCGRR